MGTSSSTQNVRNDEVEVPPNFAYKYPPRSGSYFANYFIMGGERFEASIPESYLFGDNIDLNFLGNRPLPLPYLLPPDNELTQPLTCLINIRKESVRFVRVSEDSSFYNIEFIFDSDVQCSFVIHYLCTEEVTPTGVVFHCRDENLSSQFYHYDRGVNQHFVQPSHLFDPSVYPEEELFYNVEKDIIPVAIHCVAKENSEDVQQSHTTIAVVERQLDGSHVLRAIKQKIFVDGLSYLLQEMYGIENKTKEIRKNIHNEEVEDTGLECVICMCELRDTLILPCKHLCLCQACADSLRYQANNCPICRSPFRALLLLKTLQKLSSPSISSCESDSDEMMTYMEISLIQALNGPVFPRRYPAITGSNTEPVLDRMEIAAVLHSTLMRNRRRSKRRSIAGSDGACEDEEPERLQNNLQMDAEEIKRNDVTGMLLVENTGMPRTENSRAEDETQDEDSEAEKLSPLLEPFEKNTCNEVDYSNNNLVHDVFEENKFETEKISGDPTIFINSDDVEINAIKAADVTDYTESDTTVTSNSQEKDRISQPGTPASTTSLRSSGDSYSSAGSSCHLLPVTKNVQ